MTRCRARRLAVLCAALLATACGDQAGSAPKKAGGPPAVLITTTQAAARPIETVETTLGSLETPNDPRIAAEVAGRLARIAVRSGERVRRGQLLAEQSPADLEQQHRADQADLARIEALLAQQERLATRQQELAGRGFISRNAAEDSRAQRDALASQLESAQARAALSAAQIRKTRLLAPFDGTVEEVMAAPGDYLKVGDPVLRLVSRQLVRVYLPFPETVARNIRPGQAVRLASPLNPEQPIVGTVEDIRPGLVEGSRALQVIATVRQEEGGPLRGGGSVNAEIVTGRRDGAIVVPEQSLVLRPAGTVVYVIAEGKAHQRVVRTGARQGGSVEITQGLAAGETVALDGAGFLSDGARVSLQERAPAATGKADPQRP